MNLILLVIFQMCFLLTHSQYCSGSYNFEYGLACVFDYDYKDPNCTEFNLIQCSWQVCVDWEQIGNSSYCAEAETEYGYSWEKCTQQCCDKSVVYPYDYASMDQCKAWLRQQFKKVIIWMCSIAGIIIVILLIVFRKKISCCCSWYDLQSCGKTIWRFLCCKKTQYREGDVEQVQKKDLRDSLLAQPSRAYYAGQTPTPS